MKFVNTVVRMTIVLSSTLSFAESRTAFMHEFEDSKQILLRQADGSISPLTSGDLWHLYPAMSADGEQVAYVAGPAAGELALYVRRFETKSLEHWSKSGGYLHPDFSGDGRFLGVSGPLGTDGLMQIGVFDVAETRKSHPKGHSDFSGAEPTVIKTGVPTYFPAVSSDGSFVAMQRSHNPTTKDIIIYDRRTDQFEIVSTQLAAAMAPELSFDDRWLTYTGKTAGGWDIYAYDRQSQRQFRITNASGDELAPTFTPDNRLLYAGSAGENFGIYMLTPRLPEPEESPSAELYISLPGNVYAPSVSGDMEYRQRALPAIPAPARSSFGAIEHGGRIYVVGGHQGPEHTYPPESFVDRTDAYDTATGAWINLALRHIPSQGFGLAALGNYVYAFGGFTYSEEHRPHWRSIDVVERYDIQANRWDIIGHLPRARSSNVVAQVGTKVYLIGGWNGTPKFENDYDGIFHPEIDVFDLLTETVEIASQRLPDPLRRAFTGVVHGEKIYLLGGLGQGATHFELLDTVSEFNTATGQWRQLPHLPFATFAPAAGIVDGRLFLFGGMFKLSDMDYTYVSHIFATGLADLAWQHTGRYLAEAKGFSTIVKLGNRELGILGGHSYTGDIDQPVASFETFGSLLWVNEQRSAGFNAARHGLWTLPPAQLNSYTTPTP